MFKKTYHHSLPILSTCISCGYFLSDPFSLRVRIYFLHITFSPAASPRHVSQGLLLLHCFLHFVYMVLLTMNLELRLFSELLTKAGYKENQNSAGRSSLHLNIVGATHSLPVPHSPPPHLCLYHGHTPML